MKLRIHRDALKLGMYIERAVVDKSSDGSESVNFVRHVLIDSPEKLERIKKKNLKFLFIDTLKAQKIDLPDQKNNGNGSDKKQEPVVERLKEVAPEKPGAEKVTPQAPKEELLESFDEDDSKKKSTRSLTSFDEELEAAREIKTAAVGNVKKMLKDAASGKSFDTEEAQEHVGDMVKSVFRNKDALLSLTRLKSFDEYTFTHSVNVTVLTLALAQDLGFPKSDLQIMGMGAMLHDVGKMLVPDEILNKPGKLDQDERNIIQNHTTFGKEILEKRGDIHKTAIMMAWEHHERVDGSGYPMGKTESELQRESMVIAVADVYDALTSARVYKPGMPPPHTLSFIKARAESEFKGDFVERFIEVIGIYPVGSVVEFNTGQIGVVREVNRDNLFRPHVMMVMNNNRQKVAPRLIEPDRYDSMDLQIVRYHDPLSFGFKVEDILDADN